MPVQQGAREDPEDRGRRVPGHRLRAGLPGPLQQRTIQVTNPTRSLLPEADFHNPKTCAYKIGLGLVK